MIARNIDVLSNPAVASQSPPIGTDWLHEIKHDGFRILALRDAKGVRLYTRNDFTSAFPWSWRRSGRCRRAPA